MMIFFPYFFRFFSRTRTLFLKKNIHPLCLRTTFKKKTFHVPFPSRYFENNPYPSLTRTRILKIYPFTLCFRSHTWVRVRDGYGFRTRTPGYGDGLRFRIRIQDGSFHLFTRTWWSEVEHQVSRWLIFSFSLFTSLPGGCLRYSFRP